MDFNADIAIRSLWQQQEHEQRIIPLDDIRAKAERLDAKARRWRSGTVLLFVLVMMIEGVQVWMETAPLERAGDALTIAALLYIAYRYRRQRMAAPPVALGSTNSLEFY